MTLAELRGTIDVGLVALRADELDALAQRLPGGRRVAQGAASYDVRDVGPACRVALVGDAATAALLDDLAPRWIFVVGVASGVPADEPSLGDLLVSTSVLDHGVEAVLDDGTRAYAHALSMHPDAAALAAVLAARRDALAALGAPEAVGRARPAVDLSLASFHGTKKTRAEVHAAVRRREGRARAPSLTSGAVLASDRALDEAELLQAWLRAPRRFRAVETGSAAVYRALHARGVPVLAIRAIGDVVGMKRSAAWIDYACHAAAAFTVGLLRTGALPARTAVAAPAAPDALADAARLARLGDAALERGEIDAAEAHYAAALPLFRALGDLRGEASSILRSGEIALRRGEAEEARRRYHEALPLFRRQKDALGEANCVARLGDLALKRADAEEARRRYQEALPLYRRAADVLGEANCVLRLGDLALRGADREGARERFTEALALYARIPEPYSMGMTHRRLARLAEAPLERRRHVEAARTLWLALGRRDLVVKLEAELGRGV
jgi:nucleoside phosphorylase